MIEIVPAKAKLTSLDAPMVYGNRGNAYFESPEVIPCLIWRLKTQNNVVLPGDGFGGCTVNLVEQDQAPAFAKELGALHR